MAIRILGVLGIFALAACVGDAPVVGESTDRSDAGADAVTPGSDGGTTSATLAISVAPASVVRGAVAALDVSVHAANLQQAMVVRVLNPPPGFVPQDLALPANQSKATLAVPTNDAASFGPISLTVEVSTTDGAVRAQASVSVLVRGAPGTVDSTFGVEGMITIPRSTGIGRVLFFVPQGTSQLYSLGEESYVTGLKRYTDNGQEDPAFTAAKWQPDTDTEWHGLYGLPALSQDADGTLHVFGGYWNTDQAQIHLRTVSNVGVLVPDFVNFGLAEGLGYIQRPGRYSDRATRLADGRIMTVDSSSAAKMWKPDGSVDTGWGTGGIKQGTSFDDAGLAVTADYVAFAGVVSGKGSASFIPKDASSPWVTCTMVNGGNLGALAAGSDDKLHVLTVGSLQGAVNTITPQLVTTNCGDGVPTASHAFTFTAGTPEVYPALGGNIVLVHQTTGGFELELLDPFNQPVPSFGTAGAMTLATPSTELTAGFVSADGHFYVLVDGGAAASYAKYLYRLWL